MKKGSKYVFEPADPAYGATLGEIKQWFEPFKSEKILEFQSLYGAVNLHQATVEDFNFAVKLEQGIRKSDYRQYSNETVTFDWIRAKTVSGYKLALFIIPVFVIPCLCLAICYKTGACDMEETSEYEQRMRTIRRYRKTVRR